ncbi:hypothetical protein OS493_014273 [Desmophyllum pertusum]|uniref:Uncharacterized protein n=1 Tax=Desmophyllum pertusum TaxID=174260 RepID=A0A9X0CRM1_9CNID|nr:hypothetical protein OS493_014273 [Desmophyllum pertusum]
MASSSNQIKKWNIYSTHYSPAKSPSSPFQAANSDQQASSTRPSSEFLPYGRQRSVFPFGIVSAYDLKEARTSSDSNDKFLPGNLQSSTATKWSSSPCLSASSASNAARWGTKILQTSPRSLDSEESFDNLLQSSVTQTRVRGHFRKRMYSCPSVAHNHRLRSFNTATSTLTGTNYQRRSASVSSIERPKKTTIDAEKSTAGDASSRDKTKELSQSLSEVKIEDGVIIIDNGKAIDLRKDKVRKIKAM